MNIRHILQVVGLINIFLSIAMVAPLAVSLYYGDGDSLIFLKSFLITLSVGLVLFLSCREPDLDISHKEGFAIVAAAWVSVAGFSSLPFILSGEFPSTLDAIFEAVSGITTTGASILTNIEGLSHGIVFWRSFIHWLGGMGIVIVALVILPFLGIGGMQLYKAEVSTVTSDKFAPRVRDMARILVGVYLLMTAIMMGLLMAGGIGFFDSFIHTVGSVATAGFSNKNLSIGFFDSLYIEAIVIMFMILGATSFSLHYGFYKEGLSVYTKNEEFRFYILVILVSTILVSINLYGSHYDSAFSSIRYALFQVTSITTTTGFSSQDYGLWPPFSQTLILILMFVGGTAGSTTGSIKCVRLLILLKVGYKEMYQLIHPHAVTPVKLNGKVIPPEVIKGVMGFSFLFIGLFALSALMLSWVGLDTMTAVSSAAASIGNIGPALGSAGPASNYFLFPDSAKCILIFNMLLGRLEIYTLLILLVPAFWRD